MFGFSAFSGAAFGATGESGVTPSTSGWGYPEWGYGGWGSSDVSASLTGASATGAGNAADLKRGSPAADALISDQCSRLSGTCSHG